MSFDKAKFFDKCRATILGPTLDQGEVTGCETILQAMVGCPVAWTAYALATAYHETAHSMKPCREIGGERYFFRMYDKGGARPSVAAALGNMQPGDGARYAGRGFVQLTGRTNYRRAEAKTGQPLLANPDLAMRADIAAEIMREGMEDGWFTGKKFADYLPTGDWGSARQFAQARRIINGTDKAALIAGYAIEFQRALAAGGW